MASSWSRQQSSGKSNRNEEKKATRAKQSSSSDKITNRFNPKTIDPFNKKEIKSAFASAYSKGTVPCRLNHGSVKHTLQWTTPVDQLECDPLLITFAQGLGETRHPYTFVAHEGFLQLLSTSSCQQITPLLPKLIPPIKSALVVDACFIKGLDALVALSNVTQEQFNPFIKNILPQMSRKLSNRELKEKIVKVLHILERNGGAESTLIIKARVPTYLSVL